MTPDMFNGLFEAIGGILLFRNCWLMFKAKTVKGVSVFTTTFFAAWGAWNCWFYPSLDQWWSFRGGLVIVTANVLWIGLILYYTWWLPRRWPTGGYVTRAPDLKWKVESCHGVPLLPGEKLLLRTAPPHACRERPS